jgi:hypothetical protein
MFVRWKWRERSKGHEPTGQWIKMAYLVESVRYDKRPRLKHVAYLGSIYEGYETVGGHPIGFWLTAWKNLNKLELEQAEWERIIAALHSVVPHESSQAEVDHRAGVWATREARNRRDLDKARGKDRSEAKADLAQTIEERTAWEEGMKRLGFRIPENLDASPTD